MSEHIKRHILGYLDKNIRYDGRNTTDYRTIIIERGVSETAEGSATVKIGETQVLVGVKLSIEKPFPDTPENGNLMVGAELLPLSSPEFEAGPPSIKSIELARVTDRGIREGHCIDVRDLCLKKGEKVWTVSVDICPINDAGNLFDAASIAALAALQNAKFPKYDAETFAVDYRDKTGGNLPIKCLPVSVTILKIGKYLIVDPNSEEEKVYDARLTVESLEDGTICALQKGGEEALTIEEIEKMVELGLEKAVEIRKLLN